MKLYARLVCYATVLATLSVAVAALADPPSVDYLYPGGAQRGQTVDVTAGGRFASWPVECRVDRDDVQVTVGEEKGKLSVSVAEDATPETCWIRLYNGEGAAALQPFRIGTLPEVLEAESNDDYRSPQVLEGATLVVNGQLARGGDVDTFAVPLVRGQTLVAAVEAHGQLGSPMDAVLQVVSPDGFVIEQNDDQRGLDPGIVFEAPEEGLYRVRMFAFPADPNQSISFSGSASYVYRLTLTVEGFVDYALPLAVQRGVTTAVELKGWNLPEDARTQSISTEADSRRVQLFHPRLAGSLALPTVPHASLVRAADAAVQAFEVPATLSGRIDKPREEHRYRFTAAQGESLQFRIASRTLGYGLDPVMELYDAEGKLIKEIDDSGGDRDAEFVQAMPNDGEFEIVVRDLYRHGGERYVYRLTVAPAEPNFELLLPGESLIVKPDEAKELAVGVTRLHGFKGEIEIAAVDLPEGVAVEPVTSASEGDSAKSVTLKFQSAGAAFSGPIRIVGRSSEPAIQRAAQVSLKVRGAADDELWLTTLPKAAE